jgi:hypothetical protein
MGWTQVSSVVLPLVGVVVGAGSTLLGQYLASRVDVRRDARERAARERTERKEAIIGFLDATEQTDHYQDRVAERGGQAEETLADLIHKVWLTKKIVELVCSGELAQVAHDYARELQLMARERRDGESSRKDKRKLLRYSFMEAARREMGYKGEPLRR